MRFILYLTRTGNYSNVNKKNWSKEVHADTGQVSLFTPNSFHHLIGFSLNSPGAIVTGNHTGT